VDVVALVAEVLDEVDAVNADDVVVVPEEVDAVDAEVEVVETLRCLS
jgi:hypothetical protein